MRIDYKLSDYELFELHESHRVEKERWRADRIKAVYLLGSQWPIRKVREALLLDDDTVRSYFKLYQSGGITELLTRNYNGSETKLSEEQIDDLILEIDTVEYSRVIDIIKYIEEQTGISYSISGASSLIKRNGLSYQKTHLIPPNADPEAQMKWRDEFYELFDSEDKDRIFYFMDSTHPTHNVSSHYVWSTCGERREVETNTGRSRLNIQGAINAKTLEIVTEMSDQMNAETTLNFLKKIEDKHPDYQEINIILDNATYHHAKIIKKYLSESKSKIQLNFLPPYSPNLNIIERYWKVFKKKVLTKHHDDFLDFKDACQDFFDTQLEYIDEIKHLFNLEFHILNG